MMVLKRVDLNELHAPIGMIFKTSSCNKPRRQHEIICVWVEAANSQSRWRCSRHVDGERSWHKKNTVCRTSRSSQKCLKNPQQIVLHFTCSTYGVSLSLSVSFKPLLIAFHRVHLPVYLVHIMWIKFFITLVAHTNERRSRLMLKMTITGSRVQIENLFILCSARWSALCMWRELSGDSIKITHTIRAREWELQDRKNIKKFVCISLKQTKSL